MIDHVTETEIRRVVICSARAHSKGNFMHKRIVVALLALGIPGIAAAGLNTVPEPETLALLAIAAAAVAIARWRRK